jgi:hypothetical protein
MAAEGVGLDFVIQTINGLFKRRPHDRSSRPPEKDLECQGLASWQFQRFIGNGNLKRPRVHGKVSFGHD